MAEQVKGIQSVEIAGSLLDTIIGAPQPLRLKDFAAAVGMSASKARMYLLSLMRIGLVAQDRDGRYLPGTKALCMGMLAVGQDRLLRAARRAMTDIGARTGDPVLLSIWDWNGSMIVASHEATGPLPMTFRVGGTTPLDTATGMAFLAHLPADVAQRAIAAHAGFGRHGAIDDELAQVRAQGFASAATVRLNSDAAISGYGALAVPVFGREGGIECVVTALHPNTLDAAGKRAEIELMLAASADASRQSGF